MALAPRASRIAAAGYNRNAELSFVRDQWIDWLNRVCPIRSGIAWTTYAPRKFDNSGQGANIQALMYHANAETLFGLNSGGKVFAWKQAQTVEQQLPLGLFPKGTPLLWLPNTREWPRVLCWVSHEDNLLQLKIISPGQEPPLNEDQLPQWIPDPKGDSSNPEGDFSLLVRNRSDYLCLAGKSEIQVAQLRETQFQRVAEAAFGHQILSYDLAISSEGPVAVVAVEEEGMYR